MLGGLDPIIIFQFSKVSDSAKATISKIPIVSSIVSKIGLPPIPIYLSEQTTGLYIDAEDRSIDIDTTVETLSDGSSPVVNQKAINSVVRIDMIGSRNSIGLTLLSALADLVVPKVSSKEYSITYLHGGITVFEGLLHSFNVAQNTENDLVKVTLELTKNNTTKKEATVEVKPVSEPVTLSGGTEGIPPGPTTPLEAGGGSALKGPTSSGTPTTSAPIRIGGGLR